MRILFVGSETDLPGELADYIGDLGDDWQVQRVEDAHAAIAEASLSPFDAIVVSPAPPGLPAATLLGQIRTLRPETIRIALIDSSGNGRVQSARLMSVAHRFLPLPLAPEVLIEALTSLEELNELLDSPRLRSAIGKIDKLPSPPHLYLNLMRALEDDEDTSAADITRIVMDDAAIAAKVLQLSNSAFFSAGRSISDLRSAVTRLGVATLRDLVLASEVFSIQTLQPAERAEMQRRALLASRIAANLLPQSSAELGATAALLADIGLLLPGVRNEREPAAEGDTRPGSAEAGAYLLGLWGLSMPIIEAVAFQRQPQRSSTRSFWVTGAVHVATAIANDEPVDESYLSKVGVISRLPAWREQAENLTAREAAA